jgi:hypothetical protein
MRPPLLPPIGVVPSLAPIAAAYHVEVMPMTMSPADAEGRI